MPFRGIGRFLFRLGENSMRAGSTSPLTPAETSTRRQVLKGMDFGVRFTFVPAGAS